MIALCCSCSSKDNGGSTPSSSGSGSSTSTVILAPAEGAVVSTVRDISFSLPDGFKADRYRLLVDGSTVKELTHAELMQSESAAGAYSIQWNPYFWAEDTENARRTLLVQSETAGSRTNSMVLNVSVHPDAKRLLKTLLPANNAVFDNSASVNLQWAPLDGAVTYEVEVYKEAPDAVFSTTTEQATQTVAELEKGAYWWRVRATNTVGETGPWSEKQTFSLTGLPAPTNPTAQVEPAEGGVYQVSMSWEQLGVARNYLVEIASAPTFNEILISESSSTTTFVTRLPLGKYYWRVASLNAANIVSDWSATGELDAGTFRVELGGSGDETAKQLLKSSSGGYLLLAATNSTEVSPDVDGMDDWLLKVDENGRKTAEHVSVAPGAERLTTIFEASDGTIFAAGSSATTLEAIVQKYNAALELVWEKKFRVIDTTATTRLTFNSLAEWNGVLYVSSALINVDGSTSGRLGNTYLLDMQSGDQLNEIPPPSIVDAKMAGYNSRLLAHTSGKLVLVGIAEVAEETSLSFLESGVYLAELVEGSWSVFWDSMGTRILNWLGHANESPDGGLIVLGGFFSRVDVVKMDLHGQLLAYNNINDPKYVDPYGPDYRYYNTTISPTPAGGFVALPLKLEESQPNTLSLAVFGPDMVLVDELQSTDETDLSSHAGPVVNEDRSVTILFSPKQSEAGGSGLVLRRMGF